jgi:hypothetical protein
LHRQSKQLVEYCLEKTTMRIKDNNQELTHKNQIETEHEIDALLLEWKSYLLSARYRDQITPIEQQRLEWTQYMQKQVNEGRTLFHLVLTYKTFAGEDHTEKWANQNFVEFYTKAFLPKLMGTRNYNRPHHRDVQPICIAFLEAHASKPIEGMDSSGNYDCRFFDRLHHHAILAVHPDNVEVMRQLDKTDFLESSAANRVMTFFKRECEPKCLLYASKSMAHHSDYLIFSGLSYTQDKYRRDANQHEALH